MIADTEAGTPVLFLHLGFPIRGFKGNAHTRVWADALFKRLSSTARGGKVVVSETIIEFLVIEILCIIHNGFACFNSVSKNCK